MAQKIKALWVILILIVLQSPAKAHEFRVMIKSDGYEEFFHDQALISSEDGMITVVDYHNNFVSASPITFQPTCTGILVKNDREELEMSSPIWVYPEHNGRLVVDSITRGDAWGFNPAYRGFIEINLVDESQLQIINTVTVEGYLYGVVPSEMSVTWPLEALKAQAIASRTYVVQAIIDAKQDGRNYHIDDSVFAQVYNNRQEDEKAKQAVDLTAGLVMVGNESQELIRAYFHSTSSGITTASHEVWGGSTRNSFPSQPVSYLCSRSILTCDLPVNWQDEASVMQFLKDKSIAGYEQQSPWFRWKISLTRQELEAIINANLDSRYQLQPEFVLTKQANDVYESQAIPTAGIGELLDLVVVARGSGGNIITLEMVTTSGSYRVSKELNVRYLLRPSREYTGKDVIIDRMDDYILNYNILPSATVAFDIHRDQAGKIVSVDIYGGGNGHGVGMSQWGAKGMAEAGYSYLEILQSFYSNISLIDVYTSDLLSRKSIDVK